MNKTEQLLKMLEHPEQYTERQWQDILAEPLPASRPTSG